MAKTEKPTAEIQSNPPSKKRYQKRRIKKDKVPKKALVELRESKLAIAPVDYRFTGLDGKQYELTYKQRLFCEYYLEFSGNKINALIEAGYDIYVKDRNGNSTGKINYGVAKNLASENLTKPNLCAYIALKLEEYGFTDENVEKQHLFLINQFDDLSSKAKGIDLYYKRKNLYPNPIQKNLQTPQEIEEAILYIRRILPGPGK